MIFGADQSIILKQFSCSFSIKNQYFSEQKSLTERAGVALHYECICCTNKIYLDFEIYDIRLKEQKSNKKTNFFCDTQICYKAL